MLRRIFADGKAGRVKREGNLMQSADSITFIFTRRDVWLTEMTWKGQRGWEKSRNLRTKAFSKNQSQHVGHFWLVGKVLEPPGTSTGVVKCRARFSRTWREVKMVQRRDKTCTSDRRAFWSRRSTVIFKERETLRFSTCQMILSREYIPRCFQLSIPKSRRRCAIKLICLRRPLTILPFSRDQSPFDRVSCIIL